MSDVEAICAGRLPPRAKWVFEHFHLKGVRPKRDVYVRVRDLVDAFEGVPKDGRITHPGSGRHAGSTLDYIFMRGCSVESPPKVLPALRISDHDAVFVKLKF